jgi:hypothetical protein
MPLVTALATLVLLALARMMGIVTSSAPRLGAASRRGVPLVEAKRALLLAAVLGRMSHVPVTVVTERVEAALRGMSLFAAVLAGLNAEALGRGMTDTTTMLALRGIANTESVAFLATTGTSDLGAMVDVMALLLAVGTRNLGLAIFNRVTLLLATLAKLGLRAVPVRMADLAAIIARHLGTIVDVMAALLAPATNDDLLGAIVDVMTTLVAGIAYDDLLGLIAFGDEDPLLGMELGGTRLTMKNNLTTARHWGSCSDGRFLGLALSGPEGSSFRKERKNRGASFCFTDFYRIPPTSALNNLNLFDSIHF